MALKDEINGTLALGLTVNRFRQLQGRYLFWLGQSLTPLIGNIAAQNNVQVVDGRFSAIGYDPATILFSDIPDLSYLSDSWLLAMRIMFTSVHEGPYMSIGDTDMDTVGAGFFDSVNAQTINGHLPNDVWALDRSANGFKSNVLPYDLTSTPLDQEHSLVIFYDAHAKKFGSALNGAEVAMGSGTASDLDGVIALEKFGFETDVPVSFRDIQVIRFDALPADLNKLAAYYHDNPLTKLSQWAV